MNEYLRTKRFRRVCHPANLYMLLQYLLLSTEDEIDDTFFFFHRGHVNDSVVRKFRNKCVSNYILFPKWRKTISIVWWWWLTLIKNIRWPFLATAELFTADHTYWGFLLAQDHDYTLLSDGLALYRDELSPIDVGRCHRLLLQSVFHPFPEKMWGLSERCRRICLPQPLPSHSPLQGKPIELFDFRLVWAKCPSSKRNRILSIFDLTDSDVRLMESADVVLLSQPFSEDHMCSEEEKIAGYGKILDEIGSGKKVLIKMHPREKTNYGSVFADRNVTVFSKPCPMELFALLNVGIRQVVTNISTSILCFSPNIERVWLGTRHFPSVHRKLGDVPSPLKQEGVMGC